jgi:hypothetical protein
MSALVISILVALVGWQVLRIREKGVRPSYLTLLRLSVESIETEASGLPVQSAYFRKVVTLNVALVPGMELEAYVGPPPRKVLRAILTDEMLVAILQAVSVRSTEIEGYKQKMVRDGWSIDG